MGSAILKPETIVNEIFALYEKQGNEDLIGEPVSQLEYMWQAAALAEEDGFEDEVILAAFFHDIGHLCARGHEAESQDAFGNIDHEKLGADYLRERGFSERLANLVESHIVAKRYLAYKYPDYYNQLSETSKVTLELQGGRMTAQEASQFEKDPDADLFVRLRYWDDHTKQINKQVQDISYLKIMALSHLYKNN
jgi:phosphonate degradation associated HDIG domain protein